MKLRKSLAAAAFVAGTSLAGSAYASVIFDFVCDDPVACTEPGGVFRGSIEFADAAYGAGATFSDGNGKILSFIFESTVGTPAPAQPWVLAGIIDSLANVTWTFSGDGLSLTNLGINVGPAGCAGQDAGDICFGAGGDALNVSELQVEDFGNAVENGQWVLRAAAPEPATVVLLGLALAGLGYSRRK